MKNSRIILVILAITICMAMVPGGDYCDGWKDGYEQGYCYGRNNCLKPLVPLCPIAKVGQTTYRDGYNRGFLKGKKARR